MRIRQAFVPRAPQGGSRGVLRAIIATAAVTIIATAGAVLGAGGSYALWNGAASTPASTVTAGTIIAGETFSVSPAVSSTAAPPPRRSG